MRLVYWVTSTWRMVIVTPIRSRFFFMGAATLSMEGLYRRSSKLIGSPVFTSTSLPSLFTSHPACLNRSMAARSWSRILPVPSVTGGLYSFVKTSSGIFPRMGSRTLSSSALGSPFAS